MEFLVLEVNGTRFGIPTADVREVLRAASLGAAPRRFPNMIGILNYRGQVLGVLELARLARQTRRELSPHDHLIILQAAEHRFALRVDRAVEIMTWTPGETPASRPASAEETLNDTFNAIAHPRLGMMYLLETGELWSELHYEQSDQPAQEVEAS